MKQASDRAVEGRGAADMSALYDTFNGRMAQSLAIAGGGIIPVGLIISSVFGGLAGFTGGLVGFGLASLYSAAALWTLKWAFGKPPQRMSVIMMSAFTARIVLVAAALYGLTFATALNRYALIGCFAALFLAYTTLEIVLAWKTFGLLLK